MSTDPKEIDVSTLSEKDQEFFRKYGKIPPKTLLNKKEKKYFDSADWASGLQNKPNAKPPASVADPTIKE